MTCRNCRSAIATRRYAYGQGAIRNIAPLCGPCAESLSAIGMDLRTPKVVEAPVEDKRPVWLRNLRAKDMTGGLVS